MVFTPAGTCEQETPLIEDSALSFEDVVPISEGVDALDLKRFVVDEDQPPPNSADPGEDTTDEERELGGMPRPKYGAGWWGQGTSLTTRKKGLSRPFVDGGGFPSPGRWPIDRRRLPSNATLDRIQRLLVEGLQRCEPALEKGSFKHELMRLACGRRDSSPFPLKEVERTREDIRLALLDGGFDSGLPRAGDMVQSFEVRLIQALASVSEDPDAHFCEFWAKGVWIGEKARPLPRTPAIFARKTTWNLGELEEHQQCEWQANYSSTREHLPQVQKQFEAEVEMGFMESMTLDQALARFGDRFALTAIGAIAKKAGATDVRVIFDATHGVLTNFEIRVRDHVRCPTAADLKAWLAEQAREGGPHFGLVYDISFAHRQIPVLESDWGRLACQLVGTAADTARNLAQDEEPKPRRSPLEARRVGGARKACLRPRRAHFTPAQLQEQIWINRVGTFGVGSAGYWWGRAGALLIRLSHYLTPRAMAVWLLLYADDGLVNGRSERFDRALLLHLYILAILNTPLKWAKVRGGVQLEWIGYWLDMSRFEIGISQSRADWAIRWLGDKARERRVPLGELREGLGRLTFVAGPLEHVRPLLGPLFAWASAGPRFSRPPLPVLLVVILEFLAEQLRGGRVSACREVAKDVGEVFRLDAKAAGNEVAIGGWLSRGGTATRDARWFAVSLNRINAPWAFARGEPFRVVASLELLAALIGVMVLCPEDEWRREPESTGLVTIGCATDNQGNSFLLDRLMTTKYPLGLILIELSCQLAARRMALRADWVPRLQNEEADALTNSDFRHFSSVHRVEVDLAKVEFLVLDRLLASGEEYFEQVEAAKEREKLRKQSAPNAATKRPRGDLPLRERDPW